MKFHGVRLNEGSVIKNAVIEKGPAFPSLPEEGELFYLTGPGEGLYVYDDSAWVSATPSFDPADPQTITGAWTFTQPVGVPAPTLPAHAVNRGYVDGLVADATPVAGAGLTSSGSTIDVGTASASRIVVNTDSIDLATIGTPGTYGSVTVDAYGRVSAGTNPTTLAGHGITDAQPLNGNLTAIGALAGSGLLRRTAPDLWSIDTATYLTGNENITLSGDVTGSGTTAITTTLATVLSTPGTFGSSTEIPVLTLDAKGRVTAVTVAGIPAGNTSFTISGDVTGTIDGDTDVLTLATVNSSPVTDSLVKVTTNGKGLVTATSAVVAADLTTLLDTTYVNVAGDTMTGDLLMSSTARTIFTNNLGSVSGSAPFTFLNNAATIWKQTLAGGDAEWMRLSNTGNLGVGANAPAARLHVAVSGTGNGAGDVISETAGANGNAGYRFRTNGADRFSITTAGTDGTNALRFRDENANAERLRICSGGSVAMRSPTDVDNGVFTALRIGNFTQFGSQNGGTSHTFIGWNVGGGSTNNTYRYLIGGDTAGLVELLSNGAFKFFNAPIGTAGADIVFTERFSVSPVGGIVVNGSTGAAGEVLTSQGAGASIWQPPGTVDVEDVVTSTVNCLRNTHYTLDDGAVQTNFVLPVTTAGSEVTISDFSGRTDTEVQSTQLIMGAVSPFIINVTTPVTLTFRFTGAALGWVLV